MDVLSNIFSSVQNNSKDAAMKVKTKTNVPANQNTSEDTTTSKANIYEPLSEFAMEDRVYTVYTPNSLGIHTSQESIKKGPQSNFRVKLPKITLIAWAVGLSLLAVVFVLAVAALARTGSRGRGAERCVEEKEMNKLKLPGSPTQDELYTGKTGDLPLKKEV